MKQYNHDLVTEDYYKQELEFQNDIEKQKNAKSFRQLILNGKKLSEGIVLTFPKTLKTRRYYWKSVPIQTI